MTAITRITDLAVTNTAAGADAAVAQSGRTYKLRLGTASQKDFGTGAGDVPLLNASGVLPLLQGGLGISIDPSTLTANQYIGTNASNVFGIHNLLGGGGGGPGATFATEKEVIEGTVANKAVSPATLRDWRHNIEAEIGTRFTAWDSTTTQSSTNLNNGGLIGVIPIRNNSGINAQSHAIATGSFAFFGPLCTNLPAYANFAFGAVFNDPDGVRWMLACNTANAKVFFRLSSGTWVNEGADGAGLVHTYFGIPNDNRWRPVSSLALDSWRSPAEPFFANRNATVLSAATIGFENATYYLYSTQRYAETALRPGQVDTAAIDDLAVTAAKLAGSIPYSKWLIGGTPALNRFPLLDANLILNWVDFPSTNVQPGTLEFDDFNADAIATEQDVFDDPQNNEKIIGNKVLADALEERDNQLDAFWSSWAAQSTTTLASIGNGTLAVTGLGNVTQINTSSFNVRTSSITAGTLYLCGTDCTGEPDLQGGTLRGGWLFLDSEGTRWYWPIDNPPAAASREYFRVSGSNWVAVSWKGDELRVHLHGLLNDGNWNPFAAHSIGGPGSAINAFNGETAIARRSGDKTYLLRAVYSTADNDFDILVTSQDFEIPIGNSSVGVLALDSTNTGAVGQIPQVAANGRWTFIDTPAGGNPSDILWSQTATAARATEEDIIDGTETTDSKFVGNVTLRGIAEELDNQNDWAAWSAVGTYTLADTSQLVAITLLSGAESGLNGVPLTIYNGSGYNAGTLAVPKGDLVMFTHRCAGLPTLSSGELQGLLVITNDEGDRFGITVANPEGTDAQATWQYVNGSWVARGYRGNELRTSFAGLFSNNNWEIFSSLARGGPTANEFNDEVAFARRNGRDRWIVRAVYDTTGNNSWKILTSRGQVDFALQPGEVTTTTILDSAVTNAKIQQGTIETDRLNFSNTIAASRFVRIATSDAAQFEAGTIATSDLPSGTLFYTGTPAANQIPVHNGTSWQLEAKPSPTYEDIVRFSTPKRTVDTTDQTLPSGKSFNDYDYIIIERKEQPGETVITAHSPMFLRALSVGANNEILSLPNWSSSVQTAVNVDLISATTYRFTFIGSAHNLSTEGVSAIIGVNI